MLQSSMMLEHMEHNVFFALAPSGKFDNFPSLRRDIAYY